jgi:hypothetical protein
MLLRLGSIDPDPAESIVSGAEWKLKEGSLLGEVRSSSLVTAAQASGGARTGEYSRSSQSQTCRLLFSLSLHARTRPATARGDH